MNSELHKLLMKLSNIYSKKNDIYRSKAYAKAATTILNYKEEIKSGTQALCLPGVGNSIADKIDEFIETGTLSIFETFSDQESSEESSEEDEDKADVIMLFKKIQGVGEVTASKWYDSGYRTLEDLGNVRMNRVQKLGYKYFRDLQQRIPRHEIECFEKKIRELLPNFTIEICGSYRRGLQSSGDIDCLICQKSDLDMTNIIKILKRSSILKETLTCGPTKFSGLILIPNFNVIRHLDIMIIPPKSWAYSTLYFTGSAQHNIDLRNKAISKQMTLNEYGLFDDEGNNHPVNTEEEIYMYLNLDYISPLHRN